MLTPEASVARSGALARSQACARVQLALGLGREGADHDGHAGSGLGDVDPVVEVAAERKRKLVEQEVLRGEGRVLGQAVEGRVVAVHVLVEALHDVRECLDMNDFGLSPVPFSEGIDRAQVVGIGDAAFATRAQRVFQRLHAGQVFDDEVRIAPELVTLIEVPRPVVGQRDAGNPHDQGDSQRSDEPEQERAARNDEGAEAVEEGGPIGAARSRAQRKDREQRRQEGHGVDEGAQYAERHEIAEDAKGRRIRGIQAEEPDRGGGAGEEHRPGIAAQRFGNRLVLVEAAAHARESGADDVDRMRDGDGHHDDRHAGVDGIEHRADPAGEPHGGVDDEHEHDDEGQGAEHRAQQDGGGDHDHEEHDRRHGLQIILRRLGEGAIHDHVAGQVVGSVGMARAGLVQEGVEIVGDLDHCRVRVLGQREIDHQSGYATVMGDKTPGHVGRVQRNLLDSSEVGVAERLRIVDQRLDDQIVFDGLVMGVVGERVDPGGQRRKPCGIGQILDGAERLAGEHRACARRDGDQRRLDAE